MVDWAYVKALGFDIANGDDKGDALWHLAHNNPTDHTEFIVKIVPDKSEAWIYRAEALRYYRDIEFEELQHSALCKAVASILQDIHEDLTLRQWASYYVGECLDYPAVVDMAANLCVADDDLCWNVIESLEEVTVIPNEAKTAFIASAARLSDIRVKNALLNAISS